MQKRLIELGEQRGRLRERIAQQRSALARDVQPLLAPLALPGRLAAALRQGRDFLVAHPYLAGSAAVGLLVLKPRWMWRWARRGLLAWRTWRSVRRLVPGVLGRWLGL